MPPISGRHFWNREFRVLRSVFSGGLTFKQKMPKVNRMKNPKLNIQTPKLRKAQMIELLQLLAGLTMSMMGLSAALWVIYCLFF